MFFSTNSDLYMNLTIFFLIEDFASGKISKKGRNFVMTKFVNITLSNLVYIKSFK